MFERNHSSSSKSANLPKRQAIAGQRTVRLLLVLNDAHNPINNCTNRRSGQTKHLIAKKLHNQKACHLTQRWRCMVLSPWYTTLAIYSSWNYGSSLVLSDLPDITRFISLHYVPTPLLFPFNNCF